MQATIHNEFLTLTVDTHGAEAVSLKNAAGEELLWQQNIHKNLDAHQYYN